MKLSEYTFYYFIIISFGWASIGPAAAAKDSENEIYEVKSLRKEEISTDLNRYIFNVYNKRTRQDYLISMENMTTIVERTEIVRDKLVAFGSVKDIASGVTVLDLKVNRETDFIICYRPHLSDTKSYLIYEKFYPRFAPEEVKSDLILIYDLRQSPADNRVEKKYKDYKEKSKRIGDPEYLIASENVGHPVYPKENAANQTYFVWIPLPEERHLVFPKGTYLWLDKDNKVLFLDKYRGENWLVVVDLSKELDKTTLKTKRIDVESILYLDPKAPDYQKLLSKEKERFWATELRKGRNGRIAIILQPNASYKVTEYEIELP